ncbi:MAG: NADH-quinone oxidoreductase subunit N [Alphaproteobacteria bacterium]
MIQVPFGAAEWQSIAPFALVAIGGMIALLWAVFAEERPGTTPVMWMAQAGLAAGAVATFSMFGTERSAFGGTFALDGMALLANVVFLVAASMTMFMAQGHLDGMGVRAREFYPLVLFATSGMMIMACARDLVVLFLGIEVMSLAAYVLAGIHRRDRGSTEAALKYFVLGAFATCFLLYGIAAFYGATGATSYEGIRAGIAAAPRVALLGGIALLVVALGFKAAIVPFQAWTPDVYQGAPTAVTAFMSVGVKAAAFVGIGRLFFDALGPLHVDWQKIFWVLAALTMTVGNVLALVQRNVKRMLAYSSIAHAGYLLAGVAVGTPRAGGAVLLYLLTYAFMTLGAFGVLIALGRGEKPNDDLDDLRGLADRRPMLAGAMTIFLLSLIGIPPLAGFVGKLYLVEAAVSAGWFWLSIVTVLNSAVAAYYYLSVIIAMWMRDPVSEEPAAESRPYLSAALFVAAVGTVLLGLFPSGTLDFARHAVASIVH